MRNIHKIGPFLKWRKKFPGKAAFASVKIFTHVVDYLQDMDIFNHMGE
jgi:hypothetical protein